MDTVSSTTEAAAVMAAALILFIVVTVIAVRRKLRGQGLGMTGWLAVLFWVAVGGTMLAEKGFFPKPSPRQLKATKPTGPDYSPSVVEMAVRQKLRDPNSAIFGRMKAYDDRKWRGKSVVAVCGSVNAKNGFGGYTGSKEFVFIDKIYAVAIDNDQDNTVFVSMWNALCAGKHS